MVDWIQEFFTKASPMTTASSITDLLERQFGLAGEVAVVTGGGSGIGRAVALTLASLGANVTVLDNNLGSAKDTEAAVARMPGVIGHQQVDLTDESAVQIVIDRVAAQFGRIDLLINNAAVKLPKASVDLSVEDWNRAIATNLSGVFFCARSAARHMIAAKARRIINVVSVGGLSAGATGRSNADPSYRAAKGGVANLTRALAIEWAEHNIRVNAIAPGYVRTPMTQRLYDDPALLSSVRARIPLGRVAEPEEIAWPIVFLPSRSSYMVTGHILTVDGGLLA